MRVLNGLDAFGAPRHGLTASDLEAEGTIYQVGVPPNRVDVITLVDGVQFENAWRERVEIEIDGLRIPVIGKTHLINPPCATRHPVLGSPHFAGSRQVHIRANTATSPFSPGESIIFLLSAEAADLLARSLFPQFSSDVPDNLGIF